MLWSKSWDATKSSSQRQQAVCINEMHARVNLISVCFCNEVGDNNDNNDNDMDDENDTTPVYLVFDETTACQTLHLLTKVCLTRLCRHCRSHSLFAIGPNQNRTNFQNEQRQTHDRKRERTAAFNEPDGIPTISDRWIDNDSRQRQSWSKKTMRIGMEHARHILCIICYTYYYYR